VKSTREKIVKTLLSYPGSSINDLAEAVGINGISIRHHLTALEAEDLVTSSEERHGVGRPRLIYSLTEKGVEEFPTNYLKLTRRLLDSLNNRMPPEEIKSIFEDIGAEIAAPYEVDLDKKTLEERILILKTVMSKEGFIIDTRNNEDSYTITSLSCPYYRVGLDHPVVCALDQTIISKLLATPVKLISCICDGANHCTYHVPYKPERIND